MAQNVENKNNFGLRDAGTDKGSAIDVSVVYIVPLSAKTRALYIEIMKPISIHRALSKKMREFKNYRVLYRNVLENVLDKYSLVDERL